MPAGQCVVCHEKEAAHRCIQCHKPVCEECAFKDDQGAFCGRDCSAAYRSYKRADQRAAQASQPHTVRIVLLVLVIAAVIGLLLYVGKTKGRGPFRGLYQAPQPVPAVQQPATP
jgi:hypothetical protein